jgi:hypothetical protein
MSSDGEGGPDLPSPRRHDTRASPPPQLTPRAWLPPLAVMRDTLRLLWLDPRKPRLYPPLMKWTRCTTNWRRSTPSLLRR